METDALSNTAPLASETCPECGSTDTIRTVGYTSCGVETNYQACCACNHQWGHE